MHVCMYACMHVCMYVCMYVITYVCIYIHMSAILCLPSSWVVKCDLKSLSSRRLSVQPEGPQAITVTRYLVDGFRPDSTPEEG